MYSSGPAKGRGGASRRGTDMVVVAIIYSLLLIGTYAFMSGSLVDDSLPDLASTATIALLAAPSVILAILLAIALVRFSREYRSGAWGYRLKGRVIASFILVAGMGALPPTVFMGGLAAQAANLPAAGTIRNALESALDLALSYYSGQENRLRYIAEHDVPMVSGAKTPDASKILANLKARDQNVCAVELFSGGTSVAFAGEPEMKSPPGVAAMTRSAFLPRLSIAGAGYARYLAVPSGKTESGPRVSAMVALRFDETIDDTAANLSAALTLADSTSALAGSFTSYLVLFSVVLALPFIMLSVLFGLSAADRLQRPVAALADAIDKVTAGAERAPYLSKPGDETGQLVEAFNDVLENLDRTRGDEIRTQKVGAWRDIARKLAHELRNPLTPIRLSAERVLRRYNTDPSTINDILEKSMVAIVQETANMEALLTEFRDFARLPEPQKDWIDLRGTVDELVHLYSASWPGLHIHCDAIPPALLVRADRGYIKQALGNLIANAADATKGGGTVWIRAELVKTPESRYCRIQVRDDGCGIPADIRDKVFSPYYTTKPGGTGLGLAIVDHIIAAHGGRIRFDSAEGEGTVFYIDLPAESIDTEQGY